MKSFLLIAFAGLALCAEYPASAYAQNAGVEPGCYQIAIARGQSEIARDQAKCDQAYQTGQDEWCAQATSAARKAVCGDPELRALALERNKAYYDAVARLDSGAATTALFNDQTAWGDSYAVACGITPNSVLSFPLPPQVKKCMARAGTARLAYLRTYNGAMPSTPTAAPVAADYRSMLSAWLEAHKRYPESARVRGEQGRAILRFRVDRSGRVLDYAVISGTGYPDLDAAAEGMMRGAVLPAFPPSMTAPEAEISVTVRYGLNVGQAPEPPPGAPALQTGAARDPLLDAVHKKLLKNAFDVFARAAGGVPLATEECFNHLPNGMKVEDVSKDCPQLLAKTNASLCPDGPEKLVAQWEANRLADTISFRDFILDKEKMAQPDAYGVGKAIVLRGVYIRASESMDYLLAPGEINPMVYGRSLSSDVAIPLLLNEVGSTSREAHSALLTCREKYPPETFTGCSVIIFGFVQKCTVSMLLTNASHEEVCIKVSDVTVDPRS